MCLSTKVSSAFSLCACRSSWPAFVSAPSIGMDWANWKKKTSDARLLSHCSTDQGEWKKKKEKSFPLSTILKQLKVKYQYKKRRKIKQGGRRTSQKNLVERRTCWNSADTVTLSCNHLRKDGDEWLSAPARPESLLLWKTGPRQIAQNERAWMMGLGRAFRVTHQPSHRAGPERQIERKTRATTDGGDELQGCVNRKRMKTTTTQKEKEKKSRLRRDG